MGSFTEHLRPDSEISPASSIVYGSEGDLGVECMVRYVSDDDSYFQVSLSNPAGGFKEFRTELTPDLVVGVDLGPGANNVAKVTVKQNPNYVPEYEEEE